MNNEDINEHYWDASMMRLVDEGGNWNDIRINETNIGKVFLLKFKNVGVPEDPDEPSYQRIAVLRDVTDKHCVFDEVYYDKESGHMKTCRHTVFNQYRKIGKRIEFGAILTDEPIYRFDEEA